MEWKKFPNNKDSGTIKNTSDDVVITEDDSSGLIFVDPEISSSHTHISPTTPQSTGQGVWGTLPSGDVAQVVSYQGVALATNKAVEDLKAEVKKLQKEVEQLKRARDVILKATRGGVGDTDGDAGIVPTAPTAPTAPTPKKPGMKWKVLPAVQTVSSPSAKELFDRGDQEGVIDAALKNVGVELRTGLRYKKAVDHVADLPKDSDDDPLTFGDYCRVVDFPNSYFWWDGTSWCKEDDVEITLPSA